MMKSLKHRCATLAWHAGLGAALTIAWAASPAWAACQPNGPGVPNGATVTCTGIDTTGVGNGTQNNVTANVLSGASITLGNSSIGNTADINLNANSSITNNGTIAVGSANSLFVNQAIGVAMGANSAITNNGTITTGTNGIGIKFLGDGSSFTNNGIISAGANGATLLTLFNNTTITNTGTVDGQIFLFGNGHLFTNSGLITITNPATGSGGASGTSAINGTFTQTAAGTLALRVNNAGGADGLEALTVNLGGKLGAVVQPGLYANSTLYTQVILTLSPITSTFAQTLAFAAGTTTPLAFFTVTPTYKAFSGLGTIDLTLNRVGFGAVAGETLNEQRVGNALNSLYSTSLTGNSATIFTNLLQATSVKVLDRLSGEGAAGAQNTAFFAGSMFMSTLLDQTFAWRNGERSGVARAGAPLGYAAEQPGAFASVLKAPPVAVPTWHAWGAGFGGTQSLKGDASVGSADFSDRLAGGAFGVDYQANPDMLVGLGVGGSRSSHNVDSLATTGTLDGAHFGAYGMQRFGSAYLAALASYSRFNNSTTRTIVGLGPAETATGAFSSDQVGGRLEIGNTYAFNGIGITPFVAAQVSEQSQRGYTESSVTAGGGPGMLGLTYQPVTVWSLPTFVGAQFDTRVVFANGAVWSPYARVSWVHEFNPTRQVSAFISALPAATFTVDGARAASDSAKIDLGSRLVVSRNVAFTANVSGELSDRGQTYSGTGSLRVSW
jgi:uncharacterized protein with beta-barrel porin domain